MNPRMYDDSDVTLYETDNANPEGTEGTEDVCLFCGGTVEEHGDGCQVVAP